MTSIFGCTEYCGTSKAFHFWDNYIDNDKFKFIRMKL